MIEKFLNKSKFFRTLRASVLKSFKVFNVEFGGFPNVWMSNIRNGFGLRMRYIDIGRFSDFIPKKTKNLNFGKFPIIDYVV